MSVHFLDDDCGYCYLLNAFVHDRGSMAKWPLKKRMNLCYLSKITSTLSVSDSKTYVVKTQKRGGYSVA